MTRRYPFIGRLTLAVAVGAATLQLAGCNPVGTPAEAQAPVRERFVFIADLPMDGRVYRDLDTGCEYAVKGLYSSYTPLLQPDGRPLCRYARPNR